MDKNAEIIALIPAAGEAKRLSPLPFSKELFPSGMQDIEGCDGRRPKVVAQHLLEKMRLAGVLNAFFIIRKGKWDIPGYFGDGAFLGMHLGYLMMNLPHGTAYTIDQAYPFVKDKTVVLGFPDILFTPDNAIEQLLSKKSATEADIVLGLFPANNPGKMDMVALDAEGRVSEIHIKPEKTSLVNTWIIAAWSGSFTRFIHEYVLSDLSKRTGSADNALPADGKELHIGWAIKAALGGRMKIEAVTFAEGECIDIGTPDDLESILV